MASLKKKKSGGGGGANWMDTYGDMVTLLLCFFVLLYSISSIDEQKWMLVVQSFNKNALVSTTDTPQGPVGEDGPDGGDEMPATQVEEALNDLYQFLQEYVENNPEAGAVQVSKGDGYVFISFDDTVFFDGDSYALRPEGKEILDAIIPALEQAGPYIDELRVLGHTAQATADAHNPYPGDRFLASNRSTIVTVYFQEHMDFAKLPFGRLVQVSYGQWRPVSSNETRETRARNRRVELVVTGQDLENQLSDSFNQYYTMYEEASGTPVDPAVAGTTS